MRVLAVLGDVPFPPVGGARLRNHHLIRELAAHHDVVIAALTWGEPTPLPSFPAELHTVAWELPPDHRAADEGDASAWERLYRPDAEAYGVAYYESPALHALVSRLSAQGVDVAVFAETAVAQFRTSLAAPIPIVLDLHDVQAVKQRRRGDLDQADRLLRFERAAVADAALTVCVSHREAEAARLELGAGSVEVIPNGVDTTYFTPAAGPGDPDRLVFTGSLQTPENAEAVCWFVTSVLPLLLRRRPSLVLDVVGSRPGPALLALEGEHVRIHADVPDVRPYVAGAGVVVAPLRNGGGTRLKILEAAASGKSIVSTSVGSEGLALRDGIDLDVADEPADFAAAVLRACGDDALRLERGRAARAAAVAYDWRVLGAKWRHAVESVA